MTPIRRKLLYVFRDTMLRVRIKWGRESLTFSTHYHINRELWDGERARRNSLHYGYNAATINKYLSRLEDSIDKAFLVFESSDSIPTTAQLKATLFPDLDNSVAKAFTRFMSHGSTIRQWSLNTIKSVRCLLNLLNTYKPKLTLADITPAMIADFATWQQTHRLSTNKFKTGHQGYANSVIKKNCTILRWFVKWAINDGLLPPDTISRIDITVKTIDRPVIFLTWDELRKLEDYPFPEDSENARARDFFVFCCFTSLRFSDAHALMKTDVTQDTITVNAIKTDTRLVIDLNDHSRKILRRYACSDSPYALPRITLNRLNHLIKEIGKTLGFDSPVTISQYYGAERKSRTVPKYELLSTHCGRRTFIVNALSLGIAPNIVMKWTGHSEYSSMKPYIDIADSIRRSAMSLFNR